MNGGAAMEQDHDIWTCDCALVTVACECGAEAELPLCGLGNAVCATCASASERDWTDDD